MSVKEFRLPDPGEGLTEAEIVTWKVKVGDTVKVNDIVVEVETAKSLVELPIPFAGVVQALLVAEGQEVEVGTPIIAVDTAPGATAPAAPAAPAEQATPVQAPSADADGSSAGTGAGTGGGSDMSSGRTPVLVGYGVKTTEAVRRPRKGQPAAATQPSASSSPQPPAAQPVPTEPPAAQPTASVASTGSGRPLAKPPVRKLAQDLGVDLGTVAGSGEGGIITRDDVRAAATATVFAEEAGSAAYVPGTVTGAGPGVVGAFGTRAWSGERETRTPVKGVRKATAAAMVASAFTAPHVTEWVTVDVTATMDLVERLKADREFAGVKVTPLLVLSKAMCIGVRRHPGINVTWDEAAGEIVTKHYVNLGIAAATPRGLMVPNIKDAHLLTLRELASAIGELTVTAREGRTPPADLAGGTITITNVGVFGVDSGTPILNPGEAAIVAFGAIRRMPWVVTDADGSERIEPRWVTQLGMSFDHRMVDGELGSRYLADIAAVLHDPAKGLVWG